MNMVIFLFIETMQALFMKSEKKRRTFLVHKKDTRKMIDGFLKLSF